MAYKTTLCAILLALSTSHLAQSQETVTQETLCEFPLNNDTWFQGLLNSFVFAFGTDIQPVISDVGYQDFMIGNVQGAVEREYSCTGGGRCDTTILNEECPDNPPVASVLMAMANWANYWRDMFDAATIALTNVRLGPDGNDPITGVFNPDGQTPASEESANQARIGLIAARMMYTMMSFFPPINSVRDEIVTPRSYDEVIRDVLDTVVSAANEDEQKADYNEFADIGSSIAGLQNAMTEGIERYVDSELNNGGVFQDEFIFNSIVFQIERGEFAEAPDFRGDAFQNQLLAAVAAPAINRAWNAAQVVVIRFNSEIFPDGQNPCEGDNVFREGFKFCDADGNAHVLRRIPTGLDELLVENIILLFDPLPYEVPGINNIADFGLNTEAITRAVVENQDRHGYFGSPDEDGDFIDQLLGTDILTSSTKDTAFFNIPYCEYSVATLSEGQRALCEAASQPEFVNMCIINSILVCQCPGQLVQDVQFPFRTADAAACTLAENAPISEIVP